MPHKSIYNMQDQIIIQLQNDITAMKNQIRDLQMQLNINSNPEFVKQLLNVVKPQIVVSNIATLPEGMPTGTLAMSAASKLSFKSDTGWVVLV